MVDSADVQRIDEAADELVRPALRVRVRVSRLVEVVGEEREVGHRLHGPRCDAAAHRGHQPVEHLGLARRGVDREHGVRLVALHGLGLGLELED